jgi:HEAT repeat protein
MREIEALISELACGDEARAEAAAIKISEFGEPGFHSLLDLLRSEDSDQRWWATRALALCGGEATGEALVESLQDPDLAVRYCAALALRYVPSVPAISALLEAMASEDPLLSRLASDALASIGSPALLQLREAAQSQRIALRLGAVRALSHLGEPEAAPILFQALDDPSPLVQFWAEVGLDRLGVGMVFFEP